MPTRGQAEAEVATETAAERSQRLMAELPLTPGKVQARVVDLGEEGLWMQYFREEAWERYLLQEEGANGPENPDPNQDPATDPDWGWISIEELGRTQWEHGLTSV